ncbi:MAG: hypothetical protein KGY61_10465 [Desulfobacterales bacterium]|nr:hypothetical protein [Desulfobacterales bacterium]
MKPENFEIGKVYFEGSFLHPEYPIPEVETWIYVGMNLFEEEVEEENAYFFINPQKYYEDDLKVAIQDESFFEDIDGYYVVNESDLDAIMDIDALAAWLSGLKAAENAGKAF